MDIPEHQRTLRACCAHENDMTCEASALIAEYYAKSGDGLKWDTPEEAAAASKAAKYVAREIADAIRAMKRTVD